MFLQSLLRRCAANNKGPINIGKGVMGTCNTTGISKPVAGSSSPSSVASVSNTNTAAPCTDGSAPGWMDGASWASLGAEFQGVKEDKFLLPKPNGFLSVRATTDVQPAEEVLQSLVKHNEDMYKGLDVTDPNSMVHFDGERPTWMTLGDQVRAVSEFISGHLVHHIALEAWKELFDLKYIEMDLVYWLYVIHLHIISRRATSVKIENWHRRREVMEEMLFTMFDSWAHTSEEIMGRPPLNKIRHYIKDMYYVTAVNFEEALLHDGPGADLMLFGFLVKFCPLPRPEDIPVYTYFNLVHYIRFHTALFDRIPDEMISKGNFSFLSPNDPAITKKYTEIEFDEVIRSWKVSEDNDATE
eukprot:Tbor_TRINITY_DN3604_c0_g1::TRINITY_DN3604_c0_g1_i1::g.221::m.221